MGAGPIPGEESGNANREGSRGARGGGCLHGAVGQPGGDGRRRERPRRNDRRKRADRAPVGRGSHPGCGHGVRRDGSAPGRRWLLGRVGRPACVVHEHVGLHRSLPVLRSARTDAQRRGLSWVLRPALHLRRRLPGVAHVPGRRVRARDELCSRAELDADADRRDLRRGRGVRLRRLLHRRVSTHPSGEACINRVCGSCSSYEDCNRTSQVFGTSSGLACIHGVCAPCATNSQCGGGQACVAGTCGTCVVGSQCGPQGRCTAALCVCASDAECAAGQRRGYGVCVRM